MRYRRANIEGGTYLFTVNLADRYSDILIHQIDDLRAVWQLPQGDANSPLRWSLIKSGFSRQQERVERVRISRKAKRERGIWQRRYWEHQIHDELNLARHVDYIHFNPVKHGWAQKPVEWPYSTLHGHIKRGMAPRDWGCSIDEVVNVFGEW